jgi:hypothetical protein
MTSEGFNNTFPRAVLTPLPAQRPTAALLELLQLQVPSARGNGTLGHYALVVSNAKYVLAAQVQFDPPIAPPAAPVHAPNETGAVITEVNRQIMADHKEFALYTSTEAKLKQQVLQAVPSTYTNALKDKFIGFANVTTLAILTHLQND